MMRFLRRLLAPTVNVHVTYHVNVEGDMTSATVARLDQLLAQRDRELAALIESGSPS